MAFGDERVAFERKWHGHVSGRDQSDDFARRNNQGRRPDDNDYAVAKLISIKILRLFQLLSFLKRLKAQYSHRVKAKIRNGAVFCFVYLAYSAAKVVYLTIPAMFGGSCQNLCNKIQFSIFKG
jgi:hypothetical protein